MYQSASGMSVAQARQDVIANNLANVETSGFKRTLTLLSERRPPGADARPSGDTGGVWMLPSRLDVSQGPLEQTGNPLDVAFVGDGFLTVETPQGQRLTRDGRLRVDDAGRLVLETDPAAVLLGQDGPIELGNVRPEALTVDETGALVDGDTGENVARLRLSAAAGEDLVPVGGGLLRLRAGTAAADADGVRVTSGFVERSNVDPTVELTRLIEAARLMETNANLLRFQEQSLGKLIEASRVG